MFKIAKLTDTGLRRDINEDSILVEEGCGLFVVSDGMGGHERGEVASQMIVDSFKQSFCEIDDDETIPFVDEELGDDDETIPFVDEELGDDDKTVPLEDKKYEKIDLNNKLNNIIKQSSMNMINYATENLIETKMGATVVGLYKVLDQEEMAVFHLGDSRAYRIRDYKIERITTDHSRYEEMKSSGKYTEEELSKVGRNTITKAVGNFKALSLDIDYTGLNDDDIYLLCSDGVSDLCSDEELLNIVIDEKNNLDQACIRIKSIVYERGAKDNLSLIIFTYKK